MFKSKQQKALDTLKECVETIKKAKTILEDAGYETYGNEPSLFGVPVVSRSNVSDLVTGLKSGLKSDEARDYYLTGLNVKVDNECDKCDFVAKSKIGLGIHKSKVHGERSPHYKSSRKYYLRNKKK